MSTAAANNASPLRAEEDYAGRQIRGARPNQEDAYGVVPSEDLGGGRDLLAVVADGMGGHAAGEVASELAVQAFVSGFFDSRSSEDPGRLWDGLELANRAIAGEVAGDAGLAGMGTTLVAVLVREGAARWISVGDSSIYLVRGGAARLLNHLHVEEPEAPAEDEEPDESGGAPRKRSGALASALVGERVREVDDGPPMALESGDRLLIASDGLDTLGLDGIEAVFLEDPAASAERHAEALLRRVEEQAAPRQDNATVVVIRWE